MNTIGKAQPLRHAVIVAAAIVATACLAAWVTWRLAEGPAVDAFKVERGDLVQTVVASGRVESPRRVEIGSQVVGTVASVPVDEGATVRAGQLLIALDDSEARAALEQARSAVAQADARVTQIRTTSLPVANEAVRQAEATLINAEASLKRSKDLFDRGFVGQAALDDAQRARDVAAAQLRSAELQRESEEASGTDVRLALAALDTARASLRAAQAHLELMTIEAPVAGVLISRAVEKGSVVQPGKALLVLSPAGLTQLVVQIDEKNLGLLRLGEKAYASADAYPDQRFEAEVAYINPGIDPLRGTVEVKLNVPNPPAYLLQDMTVSVDVEVARLGGVLTVPSEAIRDGNWVLVARDGHARKQAIKLGARGLGRVEVAQGLAEGELVLSATATNVAEGKAVRARERPSQPTRRT